MLQSLILPFVFVIKVGIFFVMDFTANISSPEAWWWWW